MKHPARQPEKRPVRWGSLFVILAALLTTPVQAGVAIDWEALGSEAADLLQEYLRIDTTNPPGNEIAAAQFLQRFLDRESIPARVLVSAPGRGNLYARLSSSGKPAIVLLSHLDVVPAAASEWSLPPFGGELRKGKIYGRGAIDAKGLTVAQVMAVVALHRAGVPLTHDLILLATADEEEGGGKGAGWFAREHADLLRDAALVLNEGGRIAIQPDGRRAVFVAVAEKTPCWLKLTARGPAGHGSTPPRTSATTRLIRALDRLRRYRPPPQVTPPVQRFFAALAPFHDPPAAEHYRSLERSLSDAAFMASFNRNVRNYALIHNTMAPTVLRGSTKTNVIPSQASAEIDARLVPGESAEEFVSLVRQVIDDDEVTVNVLLTFPYSDSPPGGPLFEALTEVAAARSPAMAVIPSVLAGFTDSHFFRSLGIPTYGFTPFVLTEHDYRGVHGIDEHLSAGNLRDGTRLLTELLLALQHRAFDPRPGAPLRSKP